MRVKRGTVRHAKHKVVIKKAKGYIGRKKSVFRLAKQAILKAGQHAYYDKKKKKGVFRAGWIVKINAAVHAYNLSYSQFINKLLKANIQIDRKQLAYLAEHEPKSFEAIVKKANI